MNTENGNKVRLVDVANAVGVSANTISKAIRGTGSISDETRQLILNTAKQMGYVPNRIARSLRCGSTKTVAVVFDNLLNPYYMAMADLLHTKLKKCGYDMFIYRGVFDTIHPKDLQPLLERQVEGIVTFIEPDADAVRVLEQHKIGLVLVGRRNAELAVDSVSTDDFSGGYQAGAACIAAGAKKLGFLGAPEFLSCSARRLSGMIRCLEEHNLPCEAANLQFTYSSDIAPEIERLLDNRLDAVFCFNDIMAYKLYVSARKRGVVVPDTLMVVGYDNIQEEIAYPIKLTTVASDKPAIVERAVELLLQKLNGERPFGSFEQVEFEVFLVEGETTRPRLSEAAPLFQSIS